MKRLPFVIAFAMLLSACGNGIHIKNLTVEHQDGSQALATNQPRFSWQYETKKEKVEQIEYRIVVSTTEQNASKGIGDLWDSGVQESSRMLYIPYEGKELHSRDIAYWKVYTIVAYGDNGKKTAVESDVKSFEISLLNPDDWHAHWIGRDYEDDSLNGHTAIAARYLRKEFRLKKDIIKARLYISGLGVYSAYINNMEVAPTEWLKPTLSDYTRRIYFNAYDVTELVREDGLNAVGVTLEGGRFTTVRHDSNYLEWCGINHAAHYGLPQLLMQLEVTYKGKNIYDRLLPIATMYLKFAGNQIRHIPRYDRNPDVGILYTGKPDREYLKRWNERATLNFMSKSLGVLEQMR